jgi:hypothetical protein
VNGLSPHVVSTWIARARQKTGGRRSRRPRPRMERPALGRVDLHEIWSGASPSYSRAINTVVSGPCNFWRSGRHELRDACRLGTLKAPSVTPHPAIYRRPACQRRNGQIDRFRGACHRAGHFGPDPMALPIPRALLTVAPARLRTRWPFFTTKTRARSFVIRTSAS